MNNRCVTKTWYRSEKRGYACRDIRGLPLDNTSFKASVRLARASMRTRRVLMKEGKEGDRKIAEAFGN